MPRNIKSGLIQMSLPKTEGEGMIEEIIKAGYAYEINGSVYFDVKKYAEHHEYGKLSGRVIDELLETTRDLEGQDEKKAKTDLPCGKQRHRNIL